MVIIIADDIVTIEDIVKFAESTDRPDLVVESAKVMYQYLLGVNSSYFPDMVGNELKIVKRYLLNNYGHIVKRVDEIV